MNKGFINLLTKDIKANEKAEKELHADAEKARETGNMETYRTLRAPHTIGDMYYLIDEIARAKEIWEKDLFYYTNIYPQETSISAKCFRRNGDLETAGRLYLKYNEKNDKSELAKTSIGVTLINLGLGDLGHEYLKKRIELLDLQDLNKGRTPAGYHHLSECYYWIGELDKAQNYSRKAVEIWPDKYWLPTVKAFDFFLKYVKENTAESSKSATEWMEKAMESFYKDGDIYHAMDAKEYIRLIKSLETDHTMPENLLIDGISFWHH